MAVAPILRWVRRLVLLGLLAFAALLAWGYGRNHPEDLPWTKLDLTRPVGARTQLMATATAALVDNRFNDLEDGKAYSARIAVEHALSATTGIGVNAALGREALADPGYSTRNWRAGLLAWHDVGRATVTAEAEIGRLSADERLAVFPARRSDHYSRLSVGVTLRQLQFQGFAPVARFTVERNSSTIEFYDWRRRRTQFGVVRAF